MLGCTALTACGGGGGPGVQSVAENPPPPAPPPPPPPPAPPPPQITFDTPEFRRSDGPGFHGADEAWRSGATGEDAIIAVIDTGIDRDSPELAGRIHSASRDIVADRGGEPEDDHGTNVALVAAAARNGTGVLGIAFDADVLAIRADMPGSCGLDTPQDASLGCAFSDRAIADGIDYAVRTGAHVVNLSLGGGRASATVQGAVGRAAEAGVVIVVSAGNNGEDGGANHDPDQPDPFAQSLLDAGGGNVIIVGSVDDSGAFSSFSNRAGNAASSFLSARGERICCVYSDGEVFVETIDGQDFVTLYSGTSFAAPQVSGAVALLAQAFPNLTGQEIVEILLDTARDAGAGGTDAVYGTGVLDIAAAFRPQGMTTLAGTQTALGTAEEFALGSPAMGDALASADLSTIVTDRYNRPYTVSFGERARSSAPAPRLRAAVERRGISHAARGDSLSLAVTVGEGTLAGGLQWSETLRLSPEEALGARVLAARATAQIAPNLSVGFGISHGADGLGAQLRGAERPAFLIAGEAGDPGFIERSDLAFAARKQFGQWGVTAFAERGQVLLGPQNAIDDPRFGERVNRPSATIGMALDRSWRGFDARLGLARLSERDTLLGAQFNSAFGLGDAQTVFADAEFAYRPDPQWRLGAHVRYGMTQPGGAAFVGADSQVQSRGWSLDVTRSSTFMNGDALGLRISQPLRVSGGAIQFDLPTGFDFASETAIMSRQNLTLTPAGREIMSELNWSGNLGFGYLSGSVFHRRQPGHFFQTPDDLGALVTFDTAF
ncbi:MAG: S8 family serine peptidase [Erythrobacter sp.]